MTISSSQTREVLSIYRIFYTVRALHILAHAGFLSVLVLYADKALPKEWLGISKTSLLIGIVISKYVAEALFEMVTSAFGDRAGRYRAAKHYAVYYFGAAVCFWLGSYYGGLSPYPAHGAAITFFVVGQVMRAAGSAFLSGTLEAWAVDALKARGQTDYSQLFLNGSWVTNLSWLGGGTIALGLKAMSNPAAEDPNSVYFVQAAQVLPWLMIMIVMISVSAIASRRMAPLEADRIDRARPQGRGFRIWRRTVSKDIRDAWCTVMGAADLRWLVLPFAASYAFWLATVDLWILAYQNLDPKASLTFAWIFFCIARLIGSLVATLFVKLKLDGLWWLIGANLLNTGPLIAFLFFMNFGTESTLSVALVFFGTLLLAKIGEEILKPIRSTLLNEATPDTHLRACINSLGMFLGAIIAAVTFGVQILIKSSVPVAEGRPDPYYASLLAPFAILAFIATIGYAKVPTPAKDRKAHSNPLLYFSYAVVFILALATATLASYVPAVKADGAVVIAGRSFVHADFAQSALSIGGMVVALVCIGILVSKSRDLLYGPDSPEFQLLANEEAAKQEEPQHPRKERSRQMLVNFYNRLKDDEAMMHAYRPYLLCALLIPALVFSGRALYLWPAGLPPYPSLIFLTYTVGFLFLWLPVSLLFLDKKMPGGILLGLLWFSACSTFFVLIKKQVISIPPSTFSWISGASHDAISAAIRAGLGAVLASVIGGLIWLLAVMIRRRKMLDQSPDVTIEQHLAYLIWRISSQKDRWKDIKFREDLCRSLERISQAYERDIPRDIRTFDRHTQEWIWQTHGQIGAQFRILKQWVLKPGTECRDKLLEELQARYDAAMTGDTDRLLTQVNTCIVRQTGPKEIAKSVASQIAVSTGPLITIFIASGSSKVFNFTISPAMMGAGVGLGVVWFVVSILFYLDKNLSDKLTIVKDILGLLHPGK